MADRDQATIFTTEIDIGALMDESPFSLRQMMVIFLCGLLMLMDGWDSMEIAYVAPSILHQWHLAPSMLSFIFTASSLSSVAGPFIFGPLADRRGRRWITIGGTAVMGFASLMGAYSTSANEFLAWRLLTGCGLSAVMPNAMALGAEYAPARLRMFAVTVLYTGFPIGAAVAAGLSASLIPAYGWPSVLIIGGALPMALAAILLVTLPESIRFLALWRPYGTQLRTQLGKINPHWQFAPDIVFVTAEKPVTGAPIGELFRDGRAPVTILIWVIFFMNILELIFLTNWSPTLLGRAGLPLDAALYSSMLMQAGAVVGALIVARAMDRFGSYPMLFPAHLLGVVAVGLFGYVVGGGSIMFVVAILMGAGIMGTQTAMNGFTANVYPTSIRSTGIGAASGIGRFGAIAGPFMGGAMLSFGLPIDRIYLLAAIPPVISTLAIVTIWWYSRTRRPTGIIAEEVIDAA